MLIFEWHHFKAVHSISPVGLHLFHSICNSFFLFVCKRKRQEENFWKEMESSHRPPISSMTQTSLYKQSVSLDSFRHSMKSLSPLTWSRKTNSGEREASGQKSLMMYGDIAAVSILQSIALQHCASIHCAEIISVTERNSWSLSSNHLSHRMQQPFRH